jgi:hypothetical protein
MKFRFLVYPVILLLIFLAACGPKATEAPYRSVVATEAPIAASDSVEEASGVTTAGEGSALQPITYEVEAGVNVSNVQTSQRMIIKNAELKLQVSDTDVAIDGVTQVTGDLGGYIISSRVWYKGASDNLLKYSTISIGVPVEQFETAMRRLRGLAIIVLDEDASGEDVTDQYVDLQSQLQNLEATSDRIRGFLEDATTVEQALKVNTELTKIEGQIEEIKGRINYLHNRAAFSTITISLEPQPPVVTPTPTMTPSPTPTPVPWKPGETFNQAGKTLTATYKGIVNLLIWFFIFFVPVLLPPILIGWGIWYLVKRKKK